MNFNMEELKATFLEESFEGLDIMENGILSIDVQHPDNEEINSIFRAIHSIKGGAGTFGFSDIVGLTHVFETILDEIRNNERDLSDDINNTFLKSIDMLKDILNAYQNNQTPNKNDIETTTNSLQAILGITEKKESKQTLPSDPISKVVIKFKPNAEILKTGNEPLRIIRELNTLGTVSANVPAIDAPSIKCDPSLVHIEWDIEINGEDLDLNEIKEVFEWVEDECDILTFEAKSKNNLTKNVNKKESSSTKEKPSNSSATKPSSTIRVETHKIDALVNLVGELIITQSMLTQSDKTNKDSSLNKDCLNIMQRQIREMQEGIIAVRMVPISTSFNRIPRIVRDTSQKLNKNIVLEITGEHTEVDKTVSEKITDPLIHIIRNAVDHGIESASDRLASNKTEPGKIHVHAYHQSGSLLIEISDNGNGINTQKVKQKAIEKGLITADNSLSDKEVNELIFAAGFSTADTISDVSGRGVGMDVVRKNISALNGEIDLYSTPGEGSIFKIKLPLTLAILDGQLARLGEQVFVIPMQSILESILLEPELVQSVQGQNSIYQLREEFIPIINLFEKLELKEETNNKREMLVIVEQDNKKFAVKVSELLNQQQVVVKSLDKNFARINEFSGATIMGDGTVALILDIASITNNEKIHKE